MEDNELHPDDQWLREAMNDTGRPADIRRIASILFSLKGQADAINAIALHMEHQLTDRGLIDQFLGE